MPAAAGRLSDGAYSFTLAAQPASGSGLRLFDTRRARPAELTRRGGAGGQRHLCLPGPLCGGGRGALPGTVGYEGAAAVLAECARHARRPGRAYAVGGGGGLGYAAVPLAGLGPVVRGDGGGLGLARGGRLCGLCRWGHTGQHDGGPCVGSGGRHSVPAEPFRAGAVGGGRAGAVGGLPVDAEGQLHRPRGVAGSVLVDAGGARVSSGGCCCRRFSARGGDSACRHRRAGGFRRLCRCLFSLHFDGV